MGLVDFAMMSLFKEELRQALLNALIELEEDCEYY